MERIAHEDDGIETGEAAGAAEDFGQLVGGLVEGADPVDAAGFGEEIEEGEVAVTPEVVEEGQAREVGKAFVVERAFLLVTGHRVAVEG
jgi:hypothetical protein